MFAKNEKKTNKEKTREMTLLAMFIAIILLMVFVPYLGFIQIGALPSVTLIHIPVLIGAVVLGRKAGVILGLTFGIGSMLRAFYSPGMDYLFIFPWVSVLPRFIFGLLAYDAYKLARRLVNKRFPALALSFAVMTLLHTLMVLPLFFSTFPIAFNNESIGNIIGEGGMDWMTQNASFTGLLTVIAATLTTNGIIEIILAGSIGAIVTDRILSVRENDGDEVVE